MKTCSVNILENTKAEIDSLAKSMRTTPEQLITHTMYLLARANREATTAECRQNAKRKAEYTNGDIVLMDEAVNYTYAFIKESFIE